MSEVPAPFNPLLTPMAVMWRRKRAPESHTWSPRTMTAARQQRKSRAGPWAGAVGLAVCRRYFRTRGDSRPPPTERIVVDRAHRARDQRLRPGRLFHRRRAEARPRRISNCALDGAVWRFRNEGNRAAFADHPEVYMPRFGGYDPVAVARGVAVPGHPLFWAVAGERLYLFYSAEARAAFRRRSAAASSQRASANGRRSRAPSRAEPAQRHVGPTVRLGRIAPGDEAGHQKFLGDLRP